MQEKRLNDIEITSKISEFKLKQKENAIYLLESLRNNNLMFQDFNKDEKKGVEKFVHWYFDLK